MREIRKRAADTHRTFREVVEEIMQAGLLATSPRKRPPSSRRFRIRPHKGGRLMPGVNLDSNSDLLDLMEGR